MYEKVKSHEIKVRDLVRVSWLRGNIKGNVLFLQWNCAFPTFFCLY